MNPSKSLTGPQPAQTATKNSKPRTPAQLAATPPNGTKSSGPSSPEGKRRSSQNAILHGLTATEHTLLMTEDPTQYEEVCNAFIDDLRPATKAELRLVEKIANLDWRLERLVMMETCVLNMEVGVNADAILERFAKIDGIGCIVEAWKESLSASHCLDLLRRYMGTLQHQFNTTLSNFYKLEAGRRARKNNRDHDPDFLPPYQRPRLNSLDPPDQPIGQAKPEEAQPDPKPAGIQNEPKPAAKSLTPIDIRRTAPSRPGAS